MSGRNGLISTAELAEILGQAGLRLFDCTTYLEPRTRRLQPPLSRRARTSHVRSRAYSGRGLSGFAGRVLRFQDHASLHDAGCWLSRGAFGRHGVSNASHVVLYSIGTPMWATRFWWMLTSLGFENVAVLDGGLDKWKLEGRSLETGPARGYPPATFTAKPKTRIFRRQARDARRDVGARHGRRQRARPAVSQGVGAEPLRPARPRPRQLQRVGRDIARSADQGVRPAWRGGS